MDIIATPSLSENDVGYLIGALSGYLSTTDIIEKINDKLKFDKEMDLHSIPKIEECAKFAYSINNMSNEQLCTLKLIFQIIGDTSKFIELALNKELAPNKVNDIAKLIIDSAKQLTNEQPVKKTRKIKKEKQ